MAEPASKLRLKAIRLPFRKERRPRSPSQVTALDVDGSTITMPDTAENQAEYPQQRQQAAGCGFQIARIVVAVTRRNSSSGVVSLAIRPS